MDKEKATKIANDLLGRYGKPKEERWTGFTAVIQEYGYGRPDEPTEEEAKIMLAQLTFHKMPVCVNGVWFDFKRGWMEDHIGQGRILAEYVKEKK